MSMQEQLNVAAHTTEQAALSTYESICGMVDISPVADEIKLDSFRDASNLAETRANERLTAAINVFLDMAGSSDQEGAPRPQNFTSWFTGRPSRKRPWLLHACYQPHSEK